MNPSYQQLTQGIRTAGRVLVTAWSLEEDDLLTAYVVAGDHCIFPDPLPEGYIRPTFSWETASAHFRDRYKTAAVCKNRFINVLNRREPMTHEILAFSLSYIGLNDPLWLPILENDKIERPWANLGSDYTLVAYNIDGRHGWYKRNRETMWRYLARVMMPKPIPWGVVEKLFWGLDEAQRCRNYR